MAAATRSTAIDPVQMNGFALGAVADLFTLDQQELPRFLELSLDLVERRAKVLGLAVRALAFDHLCVSERLLVDPRGFASSLVRRNPPLTLAEHVVIAEDQEVVAVVFVPLDHRFGRAVAVAPPRVGVGIALIPLRHGLGPAAGQLRPDRDRDPQQYPHSEGETAHE